MEFEFEIGSEEKHKVLFSFHQQMGILAVLVDGNVMIKDAIAQNLKNNFVYEFQAGQNEIHTLRFELARKLLWSQSVIYNCKVFVDGNFFMNH